MLQESLLVRGEHIPTQQPSRCLTSEASISLISELLMSQKRPPSCWHHSQICLLRSVSALMSGTGVLLPLSVADDAMGSVLMVRNLLLPTPCRLVNAGGC